MEIIDLSPSPMVSVPCGPRRARLKPVVMADPARLSGQFVRQVGPLHNCSCLSFRESVREQEQEQQWKKLGSASCGLSLSPLCSLPSYSSKESFHTWCCNWLAKSVRVEQPKTAEREKVEGKPLVAVSGGAGAL